LSFVEEKTEPIYCDGNDDSGEDSSECDDKGINANGDVLQKSDFKKQYKRTCIKS